jgi:hypothetical protein
MSYAALPAGEVFAACQKAIDDHRRLGRSSGIHETKFSRLKDLANLADRVVHTKGEKADVFVSVEDFLPINHHWPKSKEE